MFHTHTSATSPTRRCMFTVNSPFLHKLVAPSSMTLALEIILLCDLGARRISLSLTKLHLLTDQILMRANTNSISSHNMLHSKLYSVISVCFQSRSSPTPHDPLKLNHFHAYNVRDETKLFQHCGCTYLFGINKCHLFTEWGVTVNK